MANAYTVIKIGSEKVDALHALGLAVVLAWSSNAECRIINYGQEYSLKFPTKHLKPKGLEDLFDEVLKLPDSEFLKGIELNALTGEDLPAPIANLDGLLALILNYPGKMRVPSVYHAAIRGNRQPDYADLCIERVHIALSQWKRKLKKLIPLLDQDWIRSLTTDYEPNSAQIPQWTIRRENQLSICLTVEPRFTASMHRFRGDGVLGSRNNITFSGTRYMPLLIFIGAARFLRTQATKSGLVIYYIPVPKNLTINGNIFMPVYGYWPDNWQKALLLSWLSMIENPNFGKDAWQGLAFHLVSPQKGKSPITLTEGYLDLDWLRSISRRTGQILITKWTHMLKGAEQKYAVDSLIDFLLEPNLDTWITHLIAIADQIHVSFSYDERSLIEMTQILEPSLGPISSIFRREKGTKQFGRALRILGHHNRAVLNDTLGELTLANTAEEVLSILSNACFELELAKGRKPFIKLPNWTDVTYLTLDLEQKGVTKVVAALKILARTYIKNEEELITWELGGEHV